MTAFVALLFAFQDETSLPKIAEIQSFTGQVEIVNPKGVSRKPAKFGTRLKNAEIRDEDRVRTGEGSQAVILFPDASKLTLKQKGEIQILQKQLPKATPEGNTVGRRIKVKVGEMVSEVIPNKEIRTDFETPSGSAAVRGTLLSITATGGSAAVAVTDGVVRFENAKYGVGLDLLDGQNVRFSPGSLSIEVLADGGRPVTGHVGARKVGLGADTLLKIEERGDSLRATIDRGLVTIDGVETTGGFDAPRGEGADAIPVEPGMPTGAPTSETDDSAGTVLEPVTTANDLLTDDVFVDAVTSLGTASAAFDYSDNFARPNGPDVGNAWGEFINDYFSDNHPGDIPENPLLQWVLQDGRASFLNLTGSTYEGVLGRLDFPTLDTFEAQATFNYSGSIEHVGIAVNWNLVTDAGMGVFYKPILGGMELEGGHGELAQFNAPPTAPNTDFILRLSYDGSKMAGSLLDGAGALRAGPYYLSAANGDGGAFAIIAAMLSSGRVDVDDIRLRR